MGSNGVRQSLKRMPDRERLRTLRLVGYRETREYPDRQALSHGEIDTLKGLIDFQSHTRFHPVLPACPMERAEKEIIGSKKELDERFGLSVFALAFPNGAYTRREMELGGQRVAVHLSLEGYLAVHDPGGEVVAEHRQCIFRYQGVAEAPRA